MGDPSSKTCGWVTRASFVTRPPATYHSQAAIFFGVMSGVSLITALVCTYADVSWATTDAAGQLLGATMLLAGVAHFLMRDKLSSMYPPRVSAVCLRAFGQSDMAGGRREAGRGI